MGEELFESRPRVVNRPGPHLRGTLATSVEHITTCKRGRGRGPSRGRAQKCGLSLALVSIVAPRLGLDSTALAGLEEARKELRQEEAVQKCKGRSNKDRVHQELVPEKK